MKVVTLDNFDDIVNRLPENEAKNALRYLREKECYKYINRGEPWYKTLTDIQKVEVQLWYKEWLDVTDTFVKPTKPAWLK